jgi:diacylglycerol kinase (ATP)
MILGGWSRGGTLHEPESTDMKNQAMGRRLRNALSGLRAAWASERSLRIHVLALLIVVIALAWLRPGPGWTALVLAACAAVIAAELFNTALEALADHLHPQMHPRIRVVKDCAAAAVLVTALGAVAVAGALAVHLLRG